MTKIEQQTEPKIRTDGWGVDLNYKDALGEWHETARETIDLLHAAMGADAGASKPAVDDSVIVVHQGEQRTLPGAGIILLENGQTMPAATGLPGDLPTGYHRLLLDGSQTPSRLIVSPGKCWLPGDLKTWGWAVQLYAARSRESWGIGDFADLKRLAEWSAGELGAGMLLLNPLSAATPIIPQQASPYYPTSRRFFNPLWLCIEWIAGADSEHLPQLESLAQAGRDLNLSRRIDRNKVFELKMNALDSLWLHFQHDAAFDAFCKEQGEDLETFAAFCALAEHFQSGWHAWPQEYRHPGNTAVAQFVRDHANRVQFHKWVQWLVDVQLASCAGELALMQDLPIGVDPDGADAWAWQDVLAAGAGVGAPPDEFNTQGQDWGLPPFSPHKLRAAGYEPFVQTIRAGFRHGGGLRIDHVMGLFRLFWIPQGHAAADGAYVRYNAEEMLSIVALESERARAYVVGEDLGTVEESAREKLAEHRILSYRLLWFEKDQPEKFPQEALAAVTTHDLPTVAGMWTGSDLKKQQELGLNPNAESTAEIHTRLQEMAGLMPDSKMPDVIAGAYQLLAKAPSRILTAALDDALAVEERPNIPATMEDRNPNWSMALPAPIEDIVQSDLARRIAAALAR